MPTPTAGPVTSPSEALSGYWAPFSRLSRRAEHRLTIVRGAGATVWDSDGHAYLDATASLWYANVGHGRSRIAEAVAEQLSTLAAYSNFGDVTTAPTEVLTRRLARLAPLDDPLVFLTSGGSDAVDSAVKIVRRFWTMQGRPEKSVIIARAGAYHGMHGFGTSLGGIPENASGYGSDGPGGFVHTAPNDAADVAATIAALGADQVAAVFAEPVIGAGGVVPPAPGYLEALRALCDEHDVLLVADEVITGFGRLGTWFGCERFGLRPDLLLVAKGITSGYFPLGGVIAARRVWEPFYEATDAFRHGYTYSGHAAACAAALANLDIIEDEGLLARVRELEPLLASALSPLADHDLVTDVRHVGLLSSVQLVSDEGGPELMERVLTGLRSRGVLTRSIAGAALQVSPPFVVTADEIATIAGALRESLDAAR